MRFEHVTSGQDDNRDSVELALAKSLQAELTFLQAELPSWRIFANRVIRDLESAGFVILENNQEAPHGT